MAQTENPSLEILIARYQAGELSAFEAFYRRTKNLVISILKKKLSEAHAVDDVFQETYFRVHRYVMTFDPRKSESHQPALTWLMSITRNSLSDYVRKQRKCAAVELVDDIPSPSRTDARVQLNDLFQQVSKCLSEEELLVLVDRIFHEQTYDEIAITHGMTPVNARQKISRIFRKLKSGV